MTKEEQILTFGFCSPVPRPRPLSDVRDCSLTFVAAKNLIIEALVSAVVDVPRHSLHVLSGGLDTSIIASIVDDVPRCASFAESKSAIEQSIASQKAIGVTDHTFVNTNADIVGTIERLVSVDPTLCTSGDLFAYMFAESLKDECDSIVVGDGAEFHSLGFYCHDSIMRAHISNGLYDFQKASECTMRQPVLDREILKRMLDPDARRMIGMRQFFLDMSEGSFDHGARVCDVEHALGFYVDFAYDGMLKRRAKMVESVADATVLAPFMSDVFVDVCARVPLEFMWANGSRRHCLKEVARAFLPASIVDAPKNGFRAHADWHCRYGHIVNDSLLSFGLRPGPVPNMNLRRLMIAVSIDVNGVHSLRSPW